MQVVIDIDENLYTRLLYNEEHSMRDACKVCNAVRKGTPLPKGHGRIGDLDALRCENADFDTYNDYCTMFDEIDAAETIIPEDKAESEG